VSVLKLVFSEGDDVIEGIREAAKEHNINYGVFFEAEGSLKEILLISDDYREKAEFKEPVEVKTVSGKVCQQKDGYNIKMHVSLSKLSSNRKWLSGEIKRALAADNFTVSIDLKDLNKIIWTG